LLNTHIYYKNFSLQIHPADNSNADQNGEGNEIEDGDSSMIEGHLIIVVTDTGIYVYI
jgi:hypothetical protein